MPLQLVQQFIFNTPAVDYPVRVYRHDTSGLRAVLIEVPGPLCSASIVVPTGNDNDRGLPHTLEHLIFCGSKQYPNRGYLDALACRSLSAGTNAYTTEEYTAYTLTTAGADGMRNMLPVYLDHVLSPTLRDDQFITEVFHWDGQAKRQGVVFSEMASRENGLADKLMFHMRRMLYATNASYHYECGGLTPDIMLLSNEQIQKYHQSYYRPDQIALLVAGPTMDVELLSGADVMLSERWSSPPVLPSPVLQAGYHPTTERLQSRTVSFASAEDDVGELGYAWRGPEQADLKSALALKVLFRYLAETAASPLGQRFVERQQPWAAYIDYSIEMCVLPHILLSFAGVPNLAASDEESDEEEEQAVADDDGDNGAQPDLLVHGPYYQALCQELRKLVTDGFPEQQAMVNTVRRHRRKLCEELEEDPHETLQALVIQEVVAQAFLDKQQTGSKLGSQAGMFSILDELEQAPDSYWTQLIQHWLLDAPVIELIMVPDVEMTNRLEADTRKLENAKRESLGVDGLAQLAKQVADAIEANRVNVPPELVVHMPPIPAVDHVPQLSLQVDYQSPQDRARPFTTVQHLTSATMFAHLQVGLPIASLPDNLCPYLPLFEALLFESSLCLPDVPALQPLFKHGITPEQSVDYRQITTEIANDLVSHSASVGFGNYLVGHAWLPELFILSGTCEYQQYDTMVAWLVGSLAGIILEPERIGTMAHNLLGILSEMKRDGTDMASATLSRITACPQRTAPNEAAVDLSRVSRATSIYRQESFLNSVLARLASPDSREQVVRALDGIKQHLLTTHITVNSDLPELHGFLQITVPQQPATDDTLSDPSRVFIDAWDSVARSAGQRNTAQPSTPRLGPFPMPRMPYVGRLDPEVTTVGSTLVVPMSSLTASYLLCVLPCDLACPAADLAHPSHRDVFAVRLLCELLSRIDGPLCEGVRGRGYAYGAYIALHRWSGQLVYSVGEAQDPANALKALWTVLETLERDWSSVINADALDMARSSVAYQWFSRRSTVSQLPDAVLTIACEGFLQPVEQEHYYTSGIASATMEDLKRVYARYFKPFITCTEKVITVLLTPPVASDVTLAPILNDDQCRSRLGQVKEMDYRLLRIYGEGEECPEDDEDEEEEQSGEEDEE